MAKKRYGGGKSRSRRSYGSRSSKSSRGSGRARGRSSSGRVQTVRLVIEQPGGSTLSPSEQAAAFLTAGPAAKRARF